METRTEEEWALVGERIRAARQNIGMSVRELARRIDVSASHVSQVERGNASFSVRALYTVAGVLGISMDSLFATDELDLPAAVEPPADIVPELHAGDSPLDEAAIVQRAWRRPTITLASGPRWERLTPKPEAYSEFIEVIYAPSTPGAPPPTDFVRHDGREYGVIITGSLTVEVGFESTVLGPGDAIAFDSSVPHRFWNATAQEVRAIWFVLDRPVDAGTDGSSGALTAGSSRFPH